MGTKIGHGWQAVLLLQVYLSLTTLAVLTLRDNLWSRWPADGWPAAWTSRGLPQLQEMKQTRGSNDGLRSVTKTPKGISCIISLVVKLEAMRSEMPLLLAVTASGFIALLSG